MLNLTASVFIRPFPLESQEHS